MMTNMSSIKKTYSDVLSLSSFKDRVIFLKLSNTVGAPTFGGHRWLNQELYNSLEWKEFRRKIIIRDNGCDLACRDKPIAGAITIHHINPISIDDVLHKRSCVFDPENVICCSYKTHKIIHYQDISLLEEYTPRTKGDTCLWR